MDSTKRLISIDFIKTISIFGVVFIHTGNGNIITESISEIFRVSVPIFIVYFSYFLEKSLSKTNSNEEYLLILSNRFKVLFLPYAFFTILYFFILNDVSTIHLHDLITGHWSGYGWPGQYFFIILFQIIIVFPFIQKMANMTKKSIYLFFAFYILLYFLLAYFLWDISLINLISDRLFIYWVPYALLGIILSRYTNYFSTFANGYTILLFLFFILFEFFLLRKHEISHSPYILPTVLLASLLVANYFIIKQNKIDLFILDRIKKISTYISKRSLGIFVLNPLVIFLLTKYSFFNLQVENLYLNCYLNLFFTVIVFGFLLIIIAILEKTFMKKVVIN